MSMPSSSDAVATSTLHLAVLQLLLGVQAQLAREAAVMRGHVIFANALAQLMRDPFRPCAAC